MSKMATESRRYEDGSIFALVSPAWFVVCRVREGPKRLSIGCWRGGSEGPLRKVAPTTTTSLTTTLQQTENGARRREGHFGKWPLQLQHPLQRPYNKPKMVQGAERATSESGPYNYNIPYNDPTTNRKWCKAQRGPLRKVAPTTTTSLTTTLQQTENGARRREGHFGKWPLQLQHPLQRPYNKPKMVQGAERATSESGPYNYNIPYNDPTTNRKWCKAQRGPLRKVAP